MLYLLNALAGQQYQALITTTDLTGFDSKFLKDVTLLEVTHGDVVGVAPTS